MAQAECKSAQVRCDYRRSDDLDIVGEVVLISVDLNPALIVS
jgi:hypothetical protein